MKFRAYLLATTFILMFASCISVQPVTVTRVNNLQVEDMLLNPKVSFDINLHNPNNFGLTLKEFKTSAYLDDKLLTDVYIENKIRLGANSDIAIPLRTQPSIKDLMTSYLSGSLKGNLKVDGYVTVSKFLFRKKFPFTVTTKF